MTTARIQCTETVQFCVLNVYSVSWPWFITYNFYNKNTLDTWYNNNTHRYISTRYCSIITAWRLIGNNWFPSSYFSFRLSPDSYNNCGRFSVYVHRKSNTQKRSNVYYIIIFILFYTDCASPFSMYIYIFGRTAIWLINLIKLFYYFFHVHYTIYLRGTHILHCGRFPFMQRCIFSYTDGIMKIGCTATIIGVYYYYHYY